MPSVAEKRAAFRRLHEGGCFVMPNPWDPGTTRYLQHAGFKALATTSSGFAYSRGKADGGVPFPEMLARITELAAIADMPMNADFEADYAHSQREATRRNAGFRSFHRRLLRSLDRPHALQDRRLYIAAGGAMLRGLRVFSMVTS